jgi:hypothetical protein
LIPDDRALVLILGVCFAAAIVANLAAYICTLRRSWLAQAAIAGAMTAMFAWDAFGLDDDAALTYRRLIGVAWVLMAGVITPLLIVRATADLRATIQRAHEVAE